MTYDLFIDGWVEDGGDILTPGQIQTIIDNDHNRVCGFGGEFAIAYGPYRIRDHLGVIPGDSPPGTFQQNNKTVCRVKPDPMLLPLADAIREAVLLRSSDKSVVALSGGVDSSLIAAIAGRSCIAVGVAGSHDLARAASVADQIGCDCAPIEIDPGQVEEALVQILPLLPSKNPVDAGIATTIFFLSRAASSLGYSRIISGQGADELFCGYARYSESRDPAADRAADIAGLPQQIARDQAVAGLFGVRLSFPYLDMRVLRAADAVPVQDMIRSGVRKHPLRLAASLDLAEDIAWYEKKAMQYGSGIWKVIGHLARERGFKRAVQGYMNYLQEGGGEDGIQR